MISHCLNLPVAKVGLTAADTDGDGTNDGIEAAQNGLPNDASDQGQPPAPGAALSLRLAVGDESSSDSEDYHLVVNRYDSETHTETEVYQLRSGGFGQYSGDQVVSCFRQDQQYTARIQWQGSRLTYRDLVMEGLTYGTATLRLELIEVATNNVISTDVFDPIPPNPPICPTPSLLLQSVQFA